MIAKRIVLTEEGYGMFIGSIELAILNVLQSADKPLQVKEVYKRLVGLNYSWAYTTIQVTLTRLAAKGWINLIGASYGPMQYQTIYTIEQLIEQHLLVLCAKLVDGDLDHILDQALLVSRAMLRKHNDA